VKKLIRFLSTNTLVICLITLLFISSTTAYAWLSTVWQSNAFSLKASYTYVPDVEVWTKHNTQDDNGWYQATFVDQENEVNKVIKSIGTFGKEGGYDTYTHTSQFDLFFGTINNLAQEQDNLPVYVKFTISLVSGTENTISVNYSLPDNYLQVFRVVSGMQAKQNADIQLINAELNDTSKYEFLKMQYFFSETNYSLAGSEAPYTLPVDTSSGTSIDFDSLFTENTYYDISTSKIHQDNAFKYDAGGNALSTDYYLYIKFSIDPKALQKALAYEQTVGTGSSARVIGLKTEMPADLIFSTNLSIDVQSNAMATTQASSGN